MEAKAMIKAAIERAAIFSGRSRGNTGPIANIVSADCVKIFETYRLYLLMSKWQLLYLTDRYYDYNKTYDKSCH